MLFDQRPGGLEIVPRRDQDLLLHGAGNACRVRHRLGKFHRLSRPLVAHQRVVIHAVEGALEFEDLLAPGEGPGDSQGEERRFRAAVVEADLFRAGHALGDGAGELDGAFAHEEVAGALVQALANGFHHRGMGVPQQERSRTHQVVDVLVAADVTNPAALGALDHHGVEGRKAGREDRGGEQCRAGREQFAFAVAAGLAHEARHSGALLGLHAEVIHVALEALEDLASPDPDVFARSAVLVPAVFVLGVAGVPGPQLFFARRGEFPAEVRVDVLHRLDRVGHEIREVEVVELLRIARPFPPGRGIP